MVRTEIPPSTSSAPSAATSDEGSDGNAYNLILKVAGAVGTGIGVLGFVTFFGGAILWLRSNEAELPATDAIAAVPRSVLITAGAEWLVPAVLFASLAVACLFVVHLVFTAWRRVQEGAVFKEGEHLLEEAEKLRHEGEAMSLEAAPDRDFAMALVKSAELAAQAKVAPEKQRQLGEDAAAAAARADGKEQEARDKLVDAAQKQTEGEAKLEAAKAAYSGAERLTEYVSGGLILLVLPTAYYRTLFHLPIGWHTLILIGVALAVVAVSLAVYLATDRFVWFGITAFVMIGVYLGFVTYFATTNNPKAEPAAALRTGHPPVAGMYIAETSSNLYLGTFPEQEQPPRLMVIPKTQVTDLAIGPLLEPNDARRRAIGLARQLCAMKITVPKAPATTGSAAAPTAETTATGSETKSACSAAELAAVEAGLAG